MKPEILAPAGSLEKLATALHFGADAVYVGLKQFSLRNFATNFDFDELECGLIIAHDLGRKVYVALNMFPYDEDLDAMERDLKTLAKLLPDAVIVSDPGVIDLLQANAPTIPIHLSTQANTLNARSANFWTRQGVARIIVARELSIERLKRLNSQAVGEIEAFVHGAVCISYSGRCFLSLYWADRNANRGECTQPCRWKYMEIEEEKRPGQKHYVLEDDRNTHFFDARDLWALPLLEELFDAQLASWKIEGRMKSEHYVAITTDVYAQAARWLAAGDTKRYRDALPALQEEVAKVSNREFSTHFLPGGLPDRSTYQFEGSRYHNFNAFIGRVVQKRDDSIDIELKNVVKPGMELEIRERGLLTEPFTVANLALTDGTPLDFGRPTTVVRIPGRFQSEAGAIVRRVWEPKEGL